MITKIEIYPLNDKWEAKVTSPFEHKGALNTTYCNYTSLEEVLESILHDVRATNVSPPLTRESKTVQLQVSVGEKKDQ